MNSLNPREKDEAVTAVPAVSFRNVSKWFGALKVLDRITLDVPGDTVTVVCGPSGSGKSTLLRCINGLERVGEGEVAVGGRLVDDKSLASSEFRAQMGMVFQKFSLYPQMTVMQNLVLAPCRVKRMPRQEAEQRALALLGRVGLLDKTNSYPSQLSGGQQQRVAIARALIMEPSLLLFDEPTSALDPEMIREVLDVMRELADGGMTMIVVTHEMGFAREAADRVVFMDAGQVVENSACDDFFHSPSTDRARQFLDRILRH
jgi:ABC-type polar amino acid transport system ATPase subunit